VLEPPAPHVEPAPPGRVHGVRGDVDAVPVDTRLARELEEVAGGATDVEKPAIPKASPRPLEEPEVETEGRLLQGKARCPAGLARPVIGCAVDRAVHERRIHARPEAMTAGRAAQH